MASAGLCSRRSSCGGSPDSHKENDGARTAAPCVPHLQFGNSPHVGFAVPVHNNTSQYNTLFERRSDVEDPSVPDSARGIRWSLRSPRQTAEFQAGELAGMAPPATPVMHPKEGMHTSRRSSVHVTPSRSAEPRAEWRASPSPVHVKPATPVSECRPRIASPAPQEAWPACSAAYAGTHTPRAQDKAVPAPSGLRVRTPFADALNMLRQAALPPSPGQQFAQGPSVQSEAGAGWQNCQELLEAVCDLPRACCEACMCVVAAIRTAVIPRETAVLVVAAVAWIAVSLWCAFNHCAARNLLTV